MMRSGNPALKDSAFNEPRVSAENAMTIQGTVQKTALLLAVTSAMGSWSWRRPEVFLAL